jgi:LysR family nitrogen assimilation transcriptional regulator
METRRLRYFVEIADTGSINRAAAVLGLAQPALSHQLAVLETELKARLFERSPAGVTLTEAGRRLYARAQIILRQVSSLSLDLADAEGGVSGLVTLGLPPSLGLCLGVPLLETVLREHPRLRLQIVEDGSSALAHLLQRGLLDLVVLPVRISDARIDAEPLFREELRLISSTRGPAPPTTPAELAALPWIVTGSPNAIRAQVNAVFALADLEPNIVAEINSLPMVIRAVEQGLGVTLLPRAAVADALAEGRVRDTDFGDRAAHRTVHLCSRRDVVLGDAARLVRDLITAQARRLAGPGVAIVKSSTPQSDTVLAEARAPM